MNICGMNIGNILDPWKWIVTSLLLPLSLSTQVHAQARATLTVSANPVVVGTPFQLTIEVENATGKFSPPSVTGLVFLSGPRQSTSTQIINGPRSTRRSITYQVRASRKGVLAIPQIAIQTDRGTLKTKALNLRVIAGRNGQTGGQTQSKPDLWIAVESNKKSVFLGEPIVIKYQIYRRKNTLNVRRYDLPDINGCWKEQIKDSDEHWSQVVKDGQRFSTITAQTSVIFPTQTGKLKISGFSVEGSEQISFFQSRPITASAQPLQIEVKPLPSGQLDGHLGTFPGLGVAFSSSENKPTAHKAFTMTVKYSGQGNLKLLAAPAIDWPRDFEVYDPEIKDRITVDKQGERGSRTFEYVVIPRSSGDFEIALPSLSYFDCRKSKFLTIGGRVLPLNVDGDAGGTGPAMGYQSKMDVHALGHDIRFIRDHAVFKTRISQFYGSWTFLVLVALGPLGLLIYSWMRRKKKRFLSNPVARRKSRAQAQLKAALKSAGKGNEELAAAVHGFLLAELDLPLSDTGRSELKDRLHMQLGEGEGQLWLSLLAELEQGAYAGGHFDEVEVAGRIRSAKSRWSKYLGKAVAVSMMIMAAGVSHGQEVDSLWTEANKAYTEGNYQAAVDAYEQIAKDWQAFELEFNLGNAYFKMGLIGQSILHYQRAEKIMPGDTDLQANLQTSNVFVLDRIEPLPSLGLGNLWDAATASRRMDLWAHLAWILCLIGAVAWGLRLASSEISMRQSAGMTGGISWMLALLFLVLAESTANRAAVSQEAVVMVQRAEVASEPSGTTTLFVLHEGTVITLLEQREDWLRIRLANGNVGWLAGTECVEI